MAVLGAVGCTEDRPRDGAATGSPPAVAPTEPAPAAVPPAGATEPPAASTGALPGETPSPGVPEAPELPEVAPELTEVAPAPPALAGRLLVRHRDRVFELAAGPGGEVERRPLARLCRGCGGDEVAVSPNGRFLLYSTGRATLMRDLRSGEEREVLPRRSSCLRFSPDGSRFAYVAEHLYVADRSGASVLVYEAPSAVYTLFTGAGSEGEGRRRLYGEVDCPVWAGPDRLVFDRFGGPLPRALGEDTDELGRRYFEELEPNGASLAVLDPVPALEHAPGPLEVTDACASGRYLLLRNDALLAPVRAGIAELEPRRLARRREVLASGFLPGTCRPYAVTVDGLTVFDPRSGDAEATFDVDAGEAGLDAGRRWQGVWGPDPERRAAAVVDFTVDLGAGADPAACPCSISLLELATGAVRELALFGRSRGELPQVLAWLPR